MATWTVQSLICEKRLLLSLKSNPYFVASMPLKPLAMSPPTVFFTRATLLQEILLPSVTWKRKRDETWNHKKCWTELIFVKKSKSPKVRNKKEERQIRLQNFDIQKMHFFSLSSYYLEKTNASTFLLKKWAKPGLFLFISFFSPDKYSTNFDYKWKKHRWCAWDSNPGSRMEGAD